MLGHTALGREVLLFNISLDFLQKCNTKYNTRVKMWQIKILKTMEVPKQNVSQLQTLFRNFKQNVGFTDK